MQDWYCSDGFKLGNLEVASIKGVSEKSQSLDNAVSDLKQLKEEDYAQSLSELSLETDNFKTQKEQYATLIGASSEEEISSVIQTEKYEVEYLWVKLGNHATKNGITLKMDITKGASATNQKYNLLFTATGTYVNITEFIYQIENDSTLGFKIEKFKLLPTAKTTTTSTNNNNTKNTDTNTDTNTVDAEANTVDKSTASQEQNLVATFTVKDVYVDLKNTTNTNTNNTKTNENTNTTNANNNSTTNTVQ